jgi:2-(1,2-epoxy-1,2-dihydrophenyl)acetyl-CoA isomerase
MEIVDVLEKSMKKKEIRVICIRGSGKDFCSGDDLKSMGEEGFKFKPLPDGSKLPHHRMVKLIRTIQKPIIAVLKGYCLGAGFELALACDFRIASDDLEMGDHRVKRAICMMSGASWFLPRLIGLAKATELVFTGKHLNAQEAKEIGLINEFYEGTNFQEKSHEFIERIASLPTKCIGYNKRMFHYSLKNDLIPSLHNEFKLYVKNMGTDDFWEGSNSFLDKREPKYQGK